GTELEQLQAETLRLQRERDAAAAGAQPGMQQWAARGIVRGAYPQLVMVSHEAITGLLPARTTGFRLAGDLDRSLRGPAKLCASGFRVPRRTTASSFASKHGRP